MPTIDSIITWKIFSALAGILVSQCKKRRFSWLAMAAWLTDKPSLRPNFTSKQNGPPVNLILFYYDTQWCIDLSADMKLNNCNATKLKSLDVFSMFEPFFTWQFLNSAEAGRFASKNLGQYPSWQTEPAQPAQLTGPAWLEPSTTNNWQWMKV